MRKLARAVLTLALAGGLLTVAGPRAEAAPTTYVTVSDGTLIALNVQVPDGDGPWPTIIQIDGYDGGSSPMDPNSARFGSGNYATVHMSLRGTGCSSGRFDLFDRRSSQDGYEVIEWIADQTWSNGDVAIWGHSYSGLTGWLTASTQPPSLKAMSVSGLIDDLYRGIVFPGGVSNFGFPLLWTGAYRPASEYQGGVAPGVTAGDATCIANQATRVPPDTMDNPILNGLLSLGEDNQWWASHSTITYLDGINIPTHIVQSYQDEQTGPRGANLLWQRLDERKPDLPKRLLLTNGVHSTNTAPPAIRNDRIAFLDCHVRGVCGGDILDPSKRVKVFFEMHDTEAGLQANGVLEDSDWPISTTDWQRFNLGGGRMSRDPLPAFGSPYVSGSKRGGAWVYYAPPNTGSEITTAYLPDEVRYTSDAFPTDTGIAGPIAVTLYALSTAPDVEFYAELNDIDPDGNMTRLQRGSLKASHREIDPHRTDFNASGEIVRPYHPHTNTTTKLLRPDTIERFELEIFPLGHVIRAGHRLMLRVTNPPVADSIAFYIQQTAPGVTTIQSDPEHQSSILLPVVPLPALGPALGCGEQVGLEQCSNPIN